MGMSTHIRGFRVADKKWKAMKAIWDACAEQNIEPPEEVLDFFNGEYPTGEGMEVEIKEAIREGALENGEFWEVDITKLPKGVRYIRFSHSI